MNEDCLNAFGQEFVFTRAQSGESQSVTGILESGIEPEDRAPGDGSAYARLWLQAGALSPAPDKGDEISSFSTVYKIVPMEEDVAGGLWLLLRRDREVP